MGVYKQFCWKFLALAATFSAVTAGFNILADPYEVWHVGMTKGFNMLAPQAEEVERLQKPLDFMRLKEKPEVVFIGTSQILYALDMEKFQEMSGKSAYNFALRGGSMYEQRRVLEHVLANDANLQEIYIGLGFANFVSCEHRPYLGLGPEFKAEDEQYGKTCLTLENLGRTVFSWQTMTDGTGKILDNAINKWEHPYYMASGKVYDDNVERYVEKSSWEFTRTLALMERECSYRGCELAPEALGELETMLELCQQRGIKVHLFICPVHARMMEALAANWAEYEEWKRALVKLAPVLDFSGYNEITTSPAKGGLVAEDTNPYFWDVMHMKTQVGNEVLAVLAGQAAAEKAGGVLLTPKNIEEHLQGQKAGLEAWEQAHPDSVAEVRYYGGFSEIMPRELDGARADGKGVLDIRQAGRDEPRLDNKWLIVLAKAGRDNNLHITLTRQDRLFLRGLRPRTEEIPRQMYAVLEGSGGARCYALAEAIRFELAEPISSQTGNGSYSAISKALRTDLANPTGSQTREGSGFVLNTPVWDVPEGTYRLSFAEVYESGRVLEFETLVTVEVLAKGGK